MIMWVSFARPNVVTTKWLFLWEKFMHYYQFNIGDYYSHTHHLDDLEDLSYRKMIDYCYLNECCLPDKVEIIAKKIGMRTHSESIANVLEEFFVLGEYGYFQPRIMRDIEKYKSKSEKAKASANARWSKKPIKPDANALQTECEGNANQEPLTNNHKPVTNNKDSSPIGSINKVDNCPHESIAKLYMEILPELPRVAKLTDKRKKSLGAAWRSDIKCQTLEFWEGYFEAVRKSNFLMGRSSSWMADFDFVINQNKMIKVIEGAYE